MDLSAVIFVALALAWAGYLIPKALKHHDDMASDRLVEGHSDKVRVLSRKGRAAAAAAPAVAETPAPAPAPRQHATTRAAARKAAQRRRRVLGLLLVALAVVWTLTWFAYLPIWAPAIPGGMAAAWLVIARLSVRRQQRRRRVGSTAAPAAVEQEAPAATPADQAETQLEELADEDTIGVERRELEAALADDGSLWDPLPVTLPTYVNKARARRTVRTIELTGISSSGHDESASALAREAEATAQESEAAAAETEQRKVVGG